jgi:hypothetical protein
VRKAKAAVAMEKIRYIPYTTAFARHSYQEGVPFFVRNFGTCGTHLEYHSSNLGQRRAEIWQREARLSQAEVNLTRLKDGSAALKSVLRLLGSPSSIAGYLARVRPLSATDPKPKGLSRRLELLLKGGSFSCGVTGSSARVYTHGLASGLAVCQELGTVGVSANGRARSPKPLNFLFVIGMLPPREENRNGTISAPTSPGRMDLIPKDRHGLLPL